MLALSNKVWANSKFSCYIKGTEIAAGRAFELLLSKAGEESQT